MMGCQWIAGEPSAEDGCKCGRPVRPVGRALDASPDASPDASLTQRPAQRPAQRQALRSIPYCDAHLARAYLPRALHWLKLREFSAAANARVAAPDPLAPWISLLARAAGRGSRP